MEQRKLKASLIKSLKDYPDVRTAPGEDQIPMLYVQQVFICSVAYAESMTEVGLQAFVKETLRAHEDNHHV